MCHVRALPNVEYFQRTVKEDLRHNHGRGKLSTKTGTQRHTWLEPAGHARGSCSAVCVDYFLCPLFLTMATLGPGFPDALQSRTDSGRMEEAGCPFTAGKTAAADKPWVPACECSVSSWADTAKDWKHGPESRLRRPFRCPQAAGLSEPSWSVAISCERAQGEHSLLFIGSTSARQLSCEALCLVCI